MKEAVILLLFISQFLYSQTGAIRGIVKNQSTGEPISGAAIFVEGTPFGTTTDKLGWFEIKDIPPGKYSLIITAIGFEQKRVEISVLSNEISYINLELQQEQQEFKLAKTRTFRPDPNRTRLFLAPTAWSLKSGEGYIYVYGSFIPNQLTAVIIADLTGGISDFITIGGGITGLGSVAVAWFIPIPVIVPIVYVAPKIALLQNEKFGIAVGGILLLSIPLNSGNNGSAGLIFYGVTSYRFSEEISLTAGLTKVGLTGSTGIISLIGAEFRITDHIKFITENWIPLTDFPIFGERNKKVNYFSFGFRFFGEKLSAELGLIYPVGLEKGTIVREGSIADTPLSPFLRLTYNFR